MRKVTDIDKIKEMAIVFLHLDYEISDLGKLVLIHPIFGSCIQTYRDDDGEVQYIDITEDKEGYEKVVQCWENAFNNCDNLNTIFMYLRVPYWLTFFKYVNEHMSKEDYSRWLAEIWVQSENPNGDVNVSVSESARYFKKADKEIMMDEDEYDYYNSLPETIKVYRGVASGRVKNGLGEDEIVIHPRNVKDKIKTML